jgi:hypothetical protein
VDGDPRRHRAPGSEPEPPSTEAGAKKRPTLNAAVRRRRADRAFYIRLAGVMQQNARALERLKR